MEFLQCVVQILTIRKLQKINILDNSLISSEDSILTRFYNGLVGNKFQTDAEAVVYLYGEATDNNIKSYRQLKARFKKRVLNTLFFIDVNSKDYETEVQKCYFDCIRSLQELNIIQKYGGNQSLVFEIINDHYATAVKYEFYDVLTEYTAKLLTYYSVKGNIAKYTACSKDFIRFKALQNNIDSSYALFTHINCLLAAQKKIDENALESFHLQIDNLEKQADSYLAKCYNLLSRIFLLEHKHKLEEMSLVADQLLVFLETKDHAFRQSFKGIANTYKIYTLLQFRDFTKGIIFIDKNLHNTFGINWFEAMDTKLRFALNLKNIELSKQILKEVYTHKSFANLSANIKEKWYIYEGYIIFYDNYVHNGNYKFNLGKLINQVPHYYHDKSGYNLSIIILQLLFHLARKNKEEAMQLISSLRIYKTRYLKDETQIRSTEFIKALFYYDKFQMNKRKAGSVTTSFVNAVPQNAYIYNHEIIIYETLLDIVFDLL